MEWATTTKILEDLRDFGNGRAWEDFVTRFRAPVEAFGRSLGLSPADAEELAQRTLAEFADAYRQGRYVRSRGRLSDWLFGVAFRQAQGLFRENRRAAVSAPSAVMTGAADEAAATRAWDQEWERAVILRCLEQARTEIEERTFQAFELTVLRSVPPRAAAAQLGVPIKVVYNAKHRVLRRLAELRAAYNAVEAPPP